MTKVGQACKLNEGSYLHLLTLKTSFHANPSFITPKEGNHSVSKVQVLSVSAKVKFSFAVSSNCR